VATEYSNCTILICFYYLSCFINFVFLRFYQALYLSKSSIYAIQLSTTKGLEHLREALIAITEGNTDQATKSQKQFKKYLGRDPLNKILQTQIKQTKDLKIVNVEKGSD